MQVAHVIPTIPIELDRPRNLRVDWSALVDFKRKTGRDIMQSDSWTNLKSSDVRYMLYVSLRHEDPDLTEAKVGKMLSIPKLQYAMEQIGKAWTASFNGLKEGEVLRPLELTA